MRPDSHEVRAVFAFPQGSPYTIQAPVGLQPDSKGLGPTPARLVMEKSRSEVLEETLRASPDNAFARYALAMELAGLGRADEAWQHFAHLLEHHAEYSATYLQAGMFLIRQRRREEARQVLQKGLEVTARQGQAHAQREIQATLDDLLADA